MVGPACGRMCAPRVRVRVRVRVWVRVRAGHDGRLVRLPLYP